MTDSLGDRMKSQYEDRTRYTLPRRTYTILRVDGKAFHTLTRGCEKPYDRGLASAMDAVAIGLCAGTQGACLAYTQSDEVSVLLQDFQTPQTCAWFDGNIQKMVSVAAAIATHKFWVAYGEVGLFDARVFTIPDPVEVENYFIWRQNDATRNSIQMLARSEFSHKECVGLSCAQLQEKLFQERGINWNDCLPEQKRGRVIDRAEGDWFVDKAIPVFTEERTYLRYMIPLMEGFDPKEIK